MPLLNRLAAAAVFTIATVGTSAAANYAIGDTGADTVLFKSSATLEFIEGKTTRVDGNLSFDRAAPETTTGVVRVDLASLKTGIDLRDQHMRERHLETDTYPYAWYEISRVKNLIGSLQPGVAYDASIEGWFYIHGVRREQNAQVTVTMETEHTDTTLYIDGQFSIKLDEYGIERPKALFMKLAETIEIEVKLTARPSSQPPGITPPEWPVSD